MAEWQLDPENGDILGYEVTGRSTASGCLLVIMGLIAGFFVLLGGLLLGFGEDLELRGFGAIALLIGGVGVYTAFWNWGRDYRSKLEFDRHAGEFRLQNAVTHQASYRVPLTTIARVHGYKVRRRSQGGEQGHSYIRYLLALVGHDGSEIVIEASGNESHATELGQRVAEFTGLEFRNAFAADPDATPAPGSSLDAARAPGRERPLTPANPQFVLERSTPEGRELSLQGAAKTFSERLIAVAVFAVFFGAPLLIFGGSLVNIVNGDSAPGDIIFLVFGGLFSLVFYSIVVAVLLMQFRRYLIVLRADRLIVRVQIHIAGLTLLSRDVNIPAAQIASTQINMTEDGHFWLGLVVTPEYRLPMAAAMLANVGPFSKGLQTGPDSEQRISLWDIYAFQGDAKRQPAVADLEYLAGLIESEYRL